jgi:hypothetical protein
MPEDPQLSRSSFSLPRQPSPQQIENLTAALMIDSITGMGHYFPSEQIDSSSLQQSVGVIAGAVHDLADSLGIEAEPEVVRRLLHRPPSITSHAQLTALEILVLKGRLLSTIEVFCPDLDTPMSDDELAVASAYAHHYLKNPRHDATQLHSDRPFAKMVSQCVPDVLQLGWEHGITATDAHYVLVDRLLSPNDIEADFRHLTTALSRLPLLTDGVNDATLNAARESIRSAVCVRATERRDSVLASLREISALRRMEHELMVPGGIDPFCTQLQIDRYDEIGLGPRGHVQMGSAFDAAGTLVKQEGETVPKRIPKPEEIDEWIEGSKVRASASHLSPLSAARLLIVWRGAPDSARHAATQIPALMRSAVRTAWLSVLGDEDALSYLADPSHRPNDLSLRYVEASEDSGGEIYLVSSYPSDFPIHNWIEEVLGQALHSPKHASAGSTFAAMGSRLLLDADALLASCTRQSFVCSMAAAESLLVDNGPDIGARLTRRLARLLVPELDLRKRAIDTFAHLYNLRSRVVHGDDVEIPMRHAVFMRYIASSAVYRFSGLARAARSMGFPGHQKDIWKTIDDEQFSERVLIGESASNRFLPELLRDEDKIRYWTGC